MVDNVKAKPVSGSSASSSNKAKPEPKKAKPDAMGGAYGGQASTTTKEVSKAKSDAKGGAYGSSNKAATPPKTATSKQEEIQKYNEAIYGSPTGSEMGMTPNNKKTSSITDFYAEQLEKAQSEGLGTNNLDNKKPLTADINDDSVLAEVTRLRELYTNNVDENGNVNGAPIIEHFTQMGLPGIQATAAARIGIIEGYVDEMIYNGRGNVPGLVEARKNRSGGIADNVRRSIAMLKNANYNYNDGQLLETVIRPHAAAAEAFFADGDDLDGGENVGVKDIPTFHSVGKIFEYLEAKNPDALMDTIGKVRDAVEGDEAKAAFDYVYGEATDLDANGEEAPYSNGYVTSGAYAQDVAKVEMGEPEGISANILPVKVNNNNGGGGKEAINAALLQQTQATQMIQLLMALMQQLAPHLEAIGIPPEMLFGPLMQLMNMMTGATGLHNVGMGSSTMAQSPTNMFQQLLQNSFTNSGQGMSTPSNAFASLGTTGAFGL